MNKTIDLVIAQDYLNPFAPAHSPKLCAELADYLCDEASHHPSLSLEISCPAAEQERLGKAIRNTFEHRIAQLKREILALRLQGLVLLALAVGIVSLATEFNVEGTIPLGLVTITAWMLVWRTAEIFLLDIRAGFLNVRKYRHIINAQKRFV
ncbi:hypothetical protein [Pseudomonas sp. N040]|uniref:hypothetical protein n=1 Tax=Pseudomonas sp. N040 TaxID=2785325 RepID=UPI0018A3186B|nr:hypothetical protein [Pseudomonas sp. N040]MBF7731259.1 hypothetical protein [Pseudomonas sp. N040]MBW7014902.1 hypothetical protein [Pseudomonas sp. N040]